METKTAGEIAKTVIECPKTYQVKERRKTKGLGTGKEAEE